MKGSPHREEACALIVAMLPALWQATGRAADASRTLAIRAGRIMTVSSGTIENGVVIVRDGKIEEVGKDLQIPGGLRIVDANNKTVVPGFIDAHCYLACRWTGCTR